MTILITPTPTQDRVAQTATLQEAVTTKTGNQSARRWGARCGTESQMEIVLTVLIPRQESVINNASSGATWELEHATTILTASHRAQ